MTASSLRRLPAQFAAFAIVGVAAAVVHYGAAMFAALWLPVALANPVGFTVAFLVSYLGHVRFTFRLEGHEKRHRQRLPRFLVTAVSGFLLGQTILLTLTRLSGAPDWLGLAAAVASVPVITFALSRLWVFRSKSAM